MNLPPTREAGRRLRAVHDELDARRTPTSRVSTRVGQVVGVTVALVLGAVVLAAVLIAGVAAVLWLAEVLL